MPVTLTNIGLIGANANQFSVNPVGNGNWIVQGNGGIFDVVVTCNPTTPGQLSASLQVTYSGGILNAGISATAVSMPTFNIIPLSHNFGTVKLGSSSRHDFIVSNTGNGNLIMSAITLTNNPGANFVIISGGTTSSAVTLLPQHSHTITVAFSPQAIGAKSAYLNIVHNGLNSPFNGRLNGVANGPELTLIPNVSTYNFGAQFVGKSNVKVFYIKNTVKNQWIIRSSQISNNSVDSLSCANRIFS